MDNGLVEFFGKVPPAMEASFELGSYNVHWGVVFWRDNEQVVVAVWRNKGAAQDVGYRPTSAIYIRDIVMKHDDVQKSLGKNARHPVNDRELETIIRDLSKGMGYQSPNVGIQAGESGSNVR